MSLTDTSLIVVLALLALFIFALVVVGVPRWGSGFVRGATRGVEVITLNVLVIALCGVVLNDQYLFYSSWSDLLGSRSSQVVVHHGGTAHQAGATRLAGAGISREVTPTRLPPLPQPGARLQTYSVVDKPTGALAQVLVYLPVGYNQTSMRTYPVILGLHGFPGAPKSFAQLDVLNTVDTLTAQHRIAPSIVAIPRIDTPATLDTECVDGGAGQPRTDTWLAHDIPVWVVHHFRSQTVRTSWAAFGYSYGAWCAASLSMRHPDVFGAAIVMLGYFRPDFSRGYDPLTPKALQGYDLVKIAGSAPPPISMWVLTSREDPLSYPTTSKFLSVARPPLDVTATVLASGGHRNTVFTPYVPVALTWLGQAMPGFHA